VSLPAIGLLTTALFVTHLAVQLPAGRGTDRHGARAVAAVAIGITLVGCALLLASDSFTVALVGRAIVGIGSGAGFVAGIDLVRAGGGGNVLQGVYGGATMVGGGLALMIVPPLTAATDWRAPYWSAAVLAVAAAVPVAFATGLPRVRHGSVHAVRDRRLVPLGALQAATFGLAVVAGNWAVPLLERQGVGTTAAALAGGLILFSGIVTRPSGGWLIGRRDGRRLVAVSLIGVAAGSAALAVGGPLWLSAAGALVLGLSAGLPFAAIFASAQRMLPTAPASGVAVVNGAAILAILVGTPLAGLTFELPGDGRLAFAVIAALALVAFLPLRRADL
jgi:MFS family permease